MSEKARAEPSKGRSKSVQLGPKKIKVPSDWEIRPLDEVTTNSGSYGANVSAIVFVPEKPRYIRITDISDRGTLKDGDKKSISEPDAEGYFLSNGDLLFARTGATAGKSYLYRKEDGEAAYAGYLIRFVVDNSKIEPEYLQFYVQSKQYHDWVDRITRHGAQQNINASEYRNLEVIVPPLPEQRRIVEILSTVDKQIQQTGEIIEERKDLKRGLMQDLFEVSVIGEVNEGMDHELDQLGEHVEVISGTHVKSEYVSQDDSRTPYLTGPDDFEDRGFTVSKYTDDPPSFCEKGDTLVTVKGSGCGSSTFAEQRAAISRQLKALRPKDTLDPQYLYYWIQTKQELLAILAQGTSIPGLSTSDLTSLQIPLPTKESQQHIGEIFSTVDDQIEEERETKRELQELKRGLMQDLLTGRVRVNTDEIK